MRKINMSIVTDVNNNLRYSEKEFEDLEKYIKYVKEVKNKLKNIINEVADILETPERYLERIKFTLVILEGDIDYLKVEYLQTYTFIEYSKLSELELFKRFIKEIQLATNEIRIQEMAEDIKDGDFRNPQIL